MRKLLSVKYSAAAFNFAMLVLRLSVGTMMMINHGYQKIINFSTLQYKFMNFLGLGSRITLSLVIFAELFCSMFIIIGLFTRLAAIPLVIATCVIVFSVKNGDFFGEAELGALYLSGYIVLLMVGPGKISVDGLIGK